MHGYLRIYINVAKKGNLRVDMNTVGAVINKENKSKDLVYP